MYREVQAKAVKDVPAEEFIKAYAAHLKSTDKVRVAAVGRGEAAADARKGQRAPSLSYSWPTRRLSRERERQKAR